MPLDADRAARSEVGRMALAGLLAPRKTLPASLFYDEEGCRLFYRITELPEYYLTRTEKSILRDAAKHVVGVVPAGVSLVEYGASDEGKAGYFLDISGDRISTYVPIDVAGPSLERMRHRMERNYPRLSVRPVVADFLHPVPLLVPSPRVGFFPGSTIGNLDPDEAVTFLRRARESLGDDAGFLLGADLRKDSGILLPAYNDAAGVTAAFNLNLLRRLNREAGATFDLAAFRHRADWNDAESRIEMHLISTRAQTVTVAGEAVRFAEGETIHTENSYKYTPERIEAMAAAGGWELSRTWTDARRLFGIFWFRAAG